jgi:hypothetical protein
MKKTIAIVVAAIFMSGVSAFAQGTVFFANRLSAAIFAPVYASDGTTALSGAGFSAQLFAGSDATSLTAVGSPLPFRTGAGAGSWAGIDVTVPTVAPGASAFLQVRAWDNAGGTYATYAAALAGGVGTGLSTVFRSDALGGGNPPGPSPNIVGTTDPTHSMGSFNVSGTVIPEPSVLALAGLGGLALLIRRRK